MFNHKIRHPHTADKTEMRRCLSCGAWYQVTWNPHTKQWETRHACPARDN